MLLFNLYISIVNRKISWPVLVSNHFFLANCKEMYYFIIIIIKGVNVDYRSRVKRLNGLK